MARLVWALAVLSLLPMALGCGGPSGGDASGGNGGEPVGDVSGYWVSYGEGQAEVKPVGPGFTGSARVRVLPGGVLRLFSDPEGEELWGWERSGWSLHFESRLGRRIGVSSMDGVEHFKDPIPIVAEGGSYAANLSADGHIHRLYFDDASSMTLELIYSGSPPDWLAGEFSPDAGASGLQVSYTVRVPMRKVSSDQPLYLNGLWALDSDAAGTLVPSSAGWGGSTRLTLLSPAYVDFIVSGNRIEVIGKSRWYVIFRDRFGQAAVYSDVFGETRTFSADRGPMVVGGRARFWETRYGAVWEHELVRVSDDELSVKIYYTGPVPDPVKSSCFELQSGSEDLSVHGELAMRFRKIR